MQEFAIEYREDESGEKLQDGVLHLKDLKAIYRENLSDESLSPIWL